MKCGFIGHRDIIGMEETIYTYVKKLMARGINCFYSGGMGNFDKMCERAVKRAGGKIFLIAYNKSQIKESELLTIASPNLTCLKLVKFGHFPLVVLEGRQPISVLRTKTALNFPTFKVAEFLKKKFHL